ncbi:hypothetical protein ACRALDRAFT_1059594 [Sodiomyces alcalophilus JCM 7366]|uniref:uncharacterized protein n=1 Tax=Sodiomyces alcalophilus JCM 7366 TaxID=591952 RepID=UPI0039B46682
MAGQAQVLTVSPYSKVLGLDNIRGTVGEARKMRRSSETHHPVRWVDLHLQQEHRCVFRSRYLAETVPRKNTITRDALKDELRRL